MEGSTIAIAAVVYVCIAVVAMAIIHTNKGRAIHSWIKELKTNERPCLPDPGRWPVFRRGLSPPSSIGCTLALLIKKNKRPRKRTRVCAVAALLPHGRLP